MILSMRLFHRSVSGFGVPGKGVRLIDVLVLALVMAVMGPCKMVYGVIAGLPLIPVKKFGG